jgi:PIN domain nuclease of toxin-antitoxin system
VRLLLDTHTLLWWLDGDQRLPESSRFAIGETSNPVFISAVSAWEIAAKVGMGKLSGGVEVADRFSEIFAEQAFAFLSVTLAHARRVGLLPGDHRDPFDRMLIAQAQIERLKLVSNETLLDQFGCARLS